MFALVLSMAYLRTRALWVSWGLNFGWKASRALIFGLTVSGVSSHSSVVEGNPMGPFWITGGGYGLDGSWVAFFVLLAIMPVVYRVTRDLDFRYNAPVIVPGGIPVDLDAAAKRQHESAMGPPRRQSFPGADTTRERPACIQGGRRGCAGFSGGFSLRSQAGVAASSQRRLNRELTFLLERNYCLLIA